MNNLILIDGNNFMFRCFWAQKLSSGGKNIEVIYAAFRNLIAMVKKFRKEQSGEVRTVMCWDRGYSSRMKISQDAVDQKILTQTYKQVRRDNKKIEREQMTPEEREVELDRKRQMNEFCELLGLTNIQQVFLDGEEADDIIATYTMRHKESCKVFVVSSDQDYYQLIDQNVTIYNAQKGTYSGMEMLAENGLTDSLQFIEIGALSGDASDTIPGVAGWGWATALKYIAKYSTVEKMFADLKTKGKLSAKEQKAVDSEEIVKVCKQLKAMRRDLPVPELVVQNGAGYDLECAFRGLNFMSLMKDVDALVTEQADLDKIKRLVKIVTGSNIGEVKSCKCGKQFIGGECCPNCELFPVEIKKQVTVVPQPESVPESIESTHLIQGLLF